MNNNIALTDIQFSVLPANKREHIFYIHRLTKHLIGVDSLAVDYFTMMIHLAQLAFRIRQILAMNQDALDSLSIPCFHGEIKFQHNLSNKFSGLISDHRDRPTPCTSDRKSTRLNSSH